MPDFLCHMGFSKCASTTIQGYLTRLGRKSDGRFWVGDKTGMSNRHRLSNELIDNGIDANGHIGPVWDRFLIETKEHGPYDTACISAESYERADPAVVKEMMETHFADHRHFGVGYVRPHAEHLWSLFCHQWRIGMTTATLDKFLKRGGHYTRTARTQLWKDAFGDNFTMFDLRLAYDFDSPGLHLAQHLKDNDIYVPEIPATPSKNESLSIKGITVSGYFGRTYFEDSKLGPRWVLTRQAIDRLEGRIELDSPKPRPPRAMKELLIDRARADAQGLDRIARTKDGFEAALDAFEPAGDDISFALEDQFMAAEIAIIDETAQEILAEARAAV